MSDETTQSTDKSASGEVPDLAEAAEGQADPAALAAENAELKDRLMRLAAEMENLRKRTAREIHDSRSYSIAGFARDMLTATDNLGRALGVLTPQARYGADATTKSLIDGIEMTEREMLRLLEKHGITAIAAEGEKFDPHKHQAMFEVPNPEVPEGTVVQVVQTGFAIGDRVLRPAMVGVAKGGSAAKPAGADASAGDETGPDQHEAGPDQHIDKEV